MNHPSVVSVGIDVGKAKLDVACVQEDHSAIHQVFSNTAKGINALARFLKQQRTAITVPCVLEATGDYHLLAAIMLSEAGYAVKCINPLITKKYCRASVRDAKSDKIDCKRLAEIGLLESALPPFAETRTTIASRKLLSSIAHLETVRQKLSGHLQLLKETEKTLEFRESHRDTERSIGVHRTADQNVPCTYVRSGTPRSQSDRRHDARYLARTSSSALGCSRRQVLRESRSARRVRGTRRACAPERKVARKTSPLEAGQWLPAQGAVSSGVESHDASRGISACVPGDACAGEELQNVHHCVGTKISAVLVCVLLEADDRIPGIVSSNSDMYAGK
jgi:Transposase